MKNFSLGTFNVRGLCDDLKKESLASDLEKYRLDICCLQETKIKEGLDITTENGHRLICLESEQKCYGNGFIVDKKWVSSIHRYWRVNDRIAILQLNTQSNTRKHDQPTSETPRKNEIHKIKNSIIKKAKDIKNTAKKISQSTLRGLKNKIITITNKITSDAKKICTRKSNLSSSVKGSILKLKYRKSSDPKQPKTTKQLITIVNIYAPHSQLVKDDVSELDNLYSKLNDIINKFSNVSTSILLLAGDFNSIVGRKSDNDSCLGRYSRGKRNFSGQQLINFCEAHQLFISNSSFKHSARHQTTWEQKRIIRDRVLTTYNQIDYILMCQDRKHILTDARSYSGTKADSDHRLVVARMKVDWYIIYRKKTTNEHKPKINVQAMRDPAIRLEYTNAVKDKILGMDTSERSWQNIKTSIIESAENTVGRIKSNKHRNEHNSEVEQLSEQQQKLRKQIRESNNLVDLVKFKHERNQTLKKIKTILKQDRESKIDNIAAEIERTQDDAKMFSAIKQLKRKRPQNQVVHDEQGRCVTNEQEMHNIIQKHFKEHFNDEKKPNIEPFVGPPTRLGQPITPHEVRECAKRMSNNKSPGEDGIAVECIKYGPPELDAEIARILNNILEQHIQAEAIELGKSILVTIQKPQKPIGPVKNLRPINLLNVIRKILSNITLSRISTSIDNYLSPSQSAYRRGRSTSDVVWAHKWIAAKAQKFQHTKIYITGIDMTAAFDTVERDKLMDEMTTIVSEDELRMCRLLLSNTSITIQNSKAEVEAFNTNVGSPQGDGISGIFFNTYFERALRVLREKLIKHNPVNEHDYAMQSSLPKEMIYADDCDFITDDIREKHRVSGIVANTLAKENLIMNDTKTEHTVIERSTREDENWRSVKKLGSLLGDSEDVIARKQLAAAAMTSMNKIWIRNNQINITKMITLYNNLVKPVLTYNSSTWGLTQAEADSIDSYHRQQLRKVFKDSRLSNKQVYERSRSTPLSQDIRISRWRLFGHTLRMKIDSPAQKAMQFYFENNNNKSKQFRGRLRTTIATTLNKEIKLAAEKNQQCKNIIERLESVADLKKLRQLAGDRSAWKEFSTLICNIAQVKRSTPTRTTSQDDSA